MTLLSILVPTYNRRQQLQECLDSLLQTPVPCEILVGDNASTDGTERMMAGITDPRVKYHRRPENIGVVPNHNRLLEAATGEYLCIFGDDDIALPACFDLKLAILAVHPDIGGVYSRALVMDQQGLIKPTPTPNGNPPFSFIGGRDDLGAMLVNCGISWQTFVFRRSVYEDVGPLRAYDGILASDWDWLIAVARSYRLAYLHEPTVGVRLHDGNLGNQFRRQGGYANSAISIWRHHLLESDPPPVVPETLWRDLQGSLHAQVEASFPVCDESLHAHYQDQLADIRHAYRHRMAQHFATTVRHLTPDRPDLDPNGLPIFCEGLPPLPLGPHRQTVFFHEIQWGSHTWRHVVTSFARSFSAADDVELLLWLDPAQGPDCDDAGDTLAFLLREMGIALDRLPDVVLLVQRLTLQDLARLYAAVHVAVTGGDVAMVRRAARTGTFVLNRLDPEAWRHAWTVAQDTR